MLCACQPVVLVSSVSVAPLGRSRRAIPVSFFDVGGAGGAAGLTARLGIDILAG